MRPRFLISAVLLAVVAVLVGAGGAGAIVGGRPASEQYPFMASVRMPREPWFQCGGALVHQQWVLTAAHCVTGWQPGAFEIRVGSADRDAGGELRAVRQVVVHPDYSPDVALPNLWNDFALLRLDRSVALAPVPIADTVAVGARTRLIGWGRECGEYVCPNPPTVQHLKELDSQVLADKVCARQDESFNGVVEVCVDSPHGQSICQGDSGGPALVRGPSGRWELVGVASNWATTDPTLVCGTAAISYADTTVARAWLTQQATAA